MSPLARSLLALACAALLRPASPELRSNHCTTLVMGDKKINIHGMEKDGPFPISQGTVELPVAPEKKGMKLVAQQITVCAEFGHSPPFVYPIKAFTSMEVIVWPWAGVYPPLEMTIKHYYSADSDGASDTSS